MQVFQYTNHFLKVYDDLRNPLLTKVLSFLIIRKRNFSYVYLDKVLLYALLRKLYLRRLGINRTTFNKWLLKKLKLTADGKNIYLANIDAIEASAEEIEEAVSILAQTKFLRAINKRNGSVRRKAEGVFYTPYSVAKVIAEEGLAPYKKILLASLASKNSSKEIKHAYERFLRLKVLDPASGSGIILSATIDVMMHINKSLSKPLKGRTWYLNDAQFCDRIIRNNSYGVDIDKQSCLIAETMLVCKYAASPVCLNNSFVTVDTLTPSDKPVSKTKTTIEDLFAPVFQSGGFDVIVMNPPYERLKVDISSYKDLPNGDDLYREDRKKTEHKVKLYKDSGQYPLTARGVLDMYKLFIEKAIRLASAKGSVSFIVPFSLLGDISCSALRQHIFHNTVVGTVLCLPENAQIFNQVSQAFCIMGFAKGGKTESFNVFMGVSSVSPLSYKKQARVTVQDLDIVSPMSFSVPLCDEYSWEVLRKMHQHPALKKHSEIYNLRGEFDLTVGKKFIGANAQKDILIRGNHIKSYCLSFDQGSLDYVDRERLINKGILGAKHQYLDRPRLAGQQIANMGLNKRLKFALVSSGVLANSCNFVYVNDDGVFSIYYLLGLLNSFLMNWRFKLTSTNNHVNNYELDELPIPMPTQENNQVVSEIINLAKCQCQEYREEVQVEIDKLVFTLFNLSNFEVTHIYDHGPKPMTLNRKQLTFQYA